MSNKSIIRATLSQNAFWMVNKNIARQIGLEVAVVLSDLISKEEYFEARGQLDDMGGFFNTSQNLQDDLGISDRVKIRIQKKLIECDLVKIKRRGVPAKNYWYLQHENIIKMLESSTHQTVATELSTDQTVGTSEAQTVATSTPETVPAINKNKITKINNENKDPLTTSILNQVKYEFDKRYLTLYGESFSWGGNAARYGKELKTIIANSNSNFEEIIRKMDTLLSMVDNKFWKFNYTTLASRWNDITTMSKPTAELWQEDLITLWNRLTGADMGLTRPVLDMLSKRQREIGEDETKRTVMAYGVSTWHSEGKDWNLVKMLSDDAAITKHASDYRIKKLASVVKEKLNKPENTLFPEIKHDSNYQTLMAYDWMQHGESELKRFIGQKGAKMLDDGEKVNEIIDAIYTYRVDQYTGGLQKAGN